MVYKCIAAGCSNTQSASIILYSFPKAATLKHKWEKQMLQTRAYWKAATKYSHLCSEHFTDDCFKNDHAIAAQFGIKRSKKLKAGAIPSLFPRSISRAGPSKRQSQDSDGSSMEAERKRRTAAVKRERKQVEKTGWNIVSTKCTGRLC